MKAVIQRVKSACVSVAGQTVGKIDGGLFVLLGVACGDTEQNAEKLAAKIAKLRIFSAPGEDGKLTDSVIDVCGGILVVSNFTLCGNCKKGNRPDFTGAAAYDSARALYLHFTDEIIRQGVKRCESGRFGADMSISTECDGPVTIIMDTDSL